MWAHREEFSPASHLRFENGVFDSQVEEQFYHKLLPSMFGNSVQHWIHPQAPLDVIIDGRGGNSIGARRVDFLFMHPFAKPLVIELDGIEHDSAIEIDQTRDGSLERCGVKVIRVPNEEVEVGEGPI